MTKSHKMPDAETVEVATFAPASTHRTRKAEKEKQREGERETERGRQLRQGAHIVLAK